MAVGNTFGATALSSYGGFWLAFAIILTPGGFQIVSSLEEADDGLPTAFHSSFSLFLWVCSLLSCSYSLLIWIGLVRLHLNSTRLHTQVDGRLLPPFLHARFGVSHARNRIHERERCTRAQSVLRKSWRCVWPCSSIPCLVQRLGRYCRHQQQFLHHSGRSLPLV